LIANFAGGNSPEAEQSLPELRQRKEYEYLIMTGKFSIIIPVYGEGDTINSAIAAVNNLEHPENREIIVADGHPDESTIKEIKCEEVIKVSCPPGRGNQLNCGAAKATGEILVFLHADTFLPSFALQQISAALKDNGCIGGAFDLGIAADSLAFRIIEKVASWRSRLTRIPYGDQAIFIRADYFRQLGGFRNIPIMEDVDLMQRIKLGNGKIKIIPDRVATSPRRWKTEGIVFCTLRNWFLLSLFFLGVKPETLARFYK
jgi:rSAM/selenodomain-associated transferase 2